jgi:hypothetical protein
MRRLNYSRALPRPRTVPVCGLAVPRRAFMAERSISEGARGRLRGIAIAIAGKERGADGEIGSEHRDSLHRRVVPFT